MHRRTLCTASLFLYVFLPLLHAEVKNRDRPAEVEWDFNPVTKPYGGILVGSDPVAIDTIAAKILDEMRTEEGLDPIASRARQIPLSAELGLGTNNMDNIELVKLTI